MIIFSVTITKTLPFFAICRHASRFSNDGRSTRITYGFQGQIQFVLTGSSSSRITIIRITVVRRTTRVLSSRQALRTRPSRSPARVYSVFVRIGYPPSARAAFEIPRGSTRSRAYDNLDGFFIVFDRYDGLQRRIQRTGQCRST